MKTAMCDSLVKVAQIAEVQTGCHSTQEKAGMFNGQGTVPKFCKSSKYEHSRSKAVDCTCTGSLLQ